MSYPNVVQYARHVGLAANHREESQQRSTKAFDRIAQGAASSISELVSAGNAPDSLANIFADDSGIANEKPLLNNEQLRMLLSAISDPPIDLLFDSPSFWKDRLPSHKENRQLKLEEPLLMASSDKVRTDIQRVKKGFSTDFIMQNWQEHYAQGNEALSKKLSLDNKAWLYDAGRAATELEEDMKKEKIEVPRRCMNVLHEAVGSLVSPEVLSSIAQQGLTYTRQRYVKKSDLTLHEEDYAENNDFSYEDDCIDLWTPSPSDIEAGKLDPAKSLSISFDLHASDKNSIEAFVLGIGAGPNKFTNAESLSVRPNSSKKRKSIDEGASAKRKKVILDQHQEKMVDALSTCASVSGVVAHAEPQVEIHDPASMSKDLLTKIEERHDEELLVTQWSDASLDAGPVQLSVQTEPCGNEDPVSIAKTQRAPITKLEINAPCFLGSEAWEIKAKADVGQMLDYQLNQIQLADNWRMEMAKWPALPIPDHDKLLNEGLSVDFDDTINRLITPPSIITSDQLLWKPPRLMLFGDSDEESEDLSVADTDHESLLRSNDLASVTTDAQPVCLCENEVDPASGDFVTSGLKGQNQHSDSNRKMVSTSTKTSSSTRTFPKFAPATSISAFLDLRGKRFKEAVVGHDDFQLESPCDPIQSTQTSDTASMRNGAREASPVGNLVANKLETKSTATRMLPNLPLEWPRAIMINNEMFQTHLGLVKFLESYRKPPLTILYRDFSTTEGMVPDIILGPTSCLVITNLQALAQESLPGQRGTIPVPIIRDRIMHLSRKYEFVAVLVTCRSVSADDIPVVTPADTFCSSLCRASSHSSSPSSPRTVQPFHILHRTSEELANELNARTWPLVLEHGFPDSDTKRKYSRCTATAISEDETPSELQLRGMGMNALSARIVLSMLGSENVDAPDSRRSEALDRFVQMSSGCRLTLFSDIIGPEAVKSVNSTQMSMQNQ